jgi:hypothetical protein
VLETIGFIETDKLDDIKDEIEEIIKIKNDSRLPEFW